MKYSILITLILGIYFKASSQITPEKLGWKSFSINHKELGVINYFVTANKFDKEKEILLYLDGSGSYPLFQYDKRGIGSTVPINYKVLSEKYHVILISKPGVPFIDSVQTDTNTGFPIYKAPAEYTQRLSLDWRVNSAELVLNEVLGKLKVSKNKIAVVGISEGFQVGAKLISINKKITHSVLIVGNGLSQFYDFIIQNRIDAQVGTISEIQAQKNIDSLQIVFKDIYKNSKSTDKEWFGHTYLRWSSFCQNIPSDNILTFNKPIYIVAASKDKNTSVLSTDYLYLESIRQGKTNIFYKVYPFDHSFNEMITDEKGKVVSTKNHMIEVINEAIKWLNEQ